MADDRKMMTEADARKPPPLRLSRVFHAPRETVFRAWSSAEHVKRWFSPETYHRAGCEGGDARGRRL